MEVIAQVKRPDFWDFYDTVFNSIDNVYDLYRNFSEKTDLAEEILEKFEEFMKKEEENLPPHMILSKIVREWVNPSTKSYGFGIIEDAEDGSGDGILTFPEGMCDDLGWKEGDRLKIEVLDDKSFSLRKL